MIIIRLSVTLNTREDIKELYALGVTRPKQILENLEKKTGIDIPPKSDLVNYLMRMKKTMFGKSDMNLGDHAQWCDYNNLISGIELPDEPFILSYCMFFDINKHEEEKLKIIKMDAYLDSI